MHGRRVFAVLPYRAMLGKILLTAAVILAAYAVIRARMRGGGEFAGARPASAPAPLIPKGTVRAVAYGLVSVMVAGSLLWLYLDWQASREVVAVQIVNANSGEVTTYRARRADVEGRHFQTLDGRRIILADVERMILE